MLRSSAQHIVVTPLAGSAIVGDADPFVPQATLVRIDKVTILVDCGASPDFDTTVVDAVRPHAASIDAVLLTSSELRCCGSLPAVLAMLHPNVIVMGSIPTAKFGLMSTVTHMLDRFDTASIDAELPVSVDKVHAAFRRIQEVQHEQAVKLVPVSAASGTVAQTVVTARSLAAGRIVGASSYLLSHQADSVLIAHNAVPAAVDSASVRSFKVPRGTTVAIADAGAFTRTPTPAGDTDRLFKTIRDTFRRGGSVLVPTDSFARGAELLVVLQRMFAEEGLMYPLVFASPKASHFTDRLRTTIEFVKDGIFSEEHHEAFPGVHMANSIEAVDALPAGKCVVAHTSSTFETGFGAALLPAFLQDPTNTVILTDEFPTANASENLASLRTLAAAGQSAKGTRLPAWQFYERVPLEGDALAAYNDEVAARRLEDQEAQRGPIVDRPELAAEEGAWTDDSDEEDAAAASASAKKASPAKQQQQAQAEQPAKPATRLHQPPHYPVFESAFPMFPPVQQVLPPSATADASDAGAIYGQPLAEADIRRYRQHTFEHTYEETALSDVQIVKTALQVDSTPCRVTRESRPLFARAAVHVIGLSGRCTGDALQALLKELGTPRKLVFLGGTATESRAAAAWARENSIVKAPVDVFTPQLGEPVDVASAVYTLEVRLAPDVLPKRLQEVPSPLGNWQVGWLKGAVAVDMGVHSSRRTVGAENPLKRNRAEGEVVADEPAMDGEDEDADDVDDGHLEPVAAAASGHHGIRSRKTLPVLVPAAPGSAVHDAGSGARPHDARSVFIGDVDLANLKRRIQAAHVDVEAGDEPSVLIAADGICIRRRARDGQIAVEAAACPEQFTVRSKLYASFGCVL